jgi:maltose alpha-D-glucosyltransferase/alpha-amylase
VWSDNPDRYRDARIIFLDYEHSNWAWDAEAKAYYWHRFYSNQPDLNYEQPEVQRAVLQIVDFWLGMGVDGLRLDAVPYLYQRDGTSCENLPEVHDFLRKLRRHVDDKFPNRMLLAEANQWPEDAVAYLGDGDECHMAYHFPVMPRLFMAIQMEDRFPIVDILQQTPAIPETTQWAMFLRNHDELTLEMVTDEERDYMYRVYASDPSARLNLGIRRRLAPLLGNDRNRVQLMNALLFSLPGTPIIYYGDEIGMGDNFYLGDRNGVRTPMQWSGDRNAGFSRANPHRLYLPVIIDPEYHYETVNVETQHNNPQSLLWWMKRIIALRREFQAFGRGSLELLNPDNPKVLAFIRSFDEERVLVVANLSRFAQYVELDLAEWQGRIPVELFGRTQFPRVESGPYRISVGGHAFFWLSLEKSEESELAGQAREHTLSVPGEWTDIFEDTLATMFSKILRERLPSWRWFAGKARRIRKTRIADVLTLPGSSARIVLVEVEYPDGTEIYSLPLAFASGADADAVRQSASHAIIASMTARTSSEPVPGILYDAAYDPRVGQAILTAIRKRRRFKGRSGNAEATTTSVFREHAFKDGEPAPHVSGAEQSNTTLIYENRLVLKLFRHLQDGINPDVELGRFLTEEARFEHIPATAGAIEYSRGPRQAPLTLAILQAFVPSSGDGWTYTENWLQQFFDRVLTMPRDTYPAEIFAAGGEPGENDVVTQLLGSYLDFARVLGRRTGETHLALGTRSQNPAFRPEPFSALYQRSLYQSMRNQAGLVFRLLRERRRALPDNVKADAEAVLDLENAILRRFRSVLEDKIDGQRIRLHGDYHLGQVLVTGSDVTLIDFEGEPARPISERRIKRSPLRDVAGMLRSFHYAAYAALPGFGERASARLQDLEVLEPWTRLWQLRSSRTFVDTYLETTEGSGLLPSSARGVELLLGALQLNKAVYELGYELNHRPSWLRLPLRAILEYLNEDDEGGTEPTKETSR